jgi:hypothetical protein
MARPAPRPLAHRGHPPRRVTLNNPHPAAAGLLRPPPKGRKLPHCATMHPFKARNERFASRNTKKSVDNRPLSATLPLSAFLLGSSRRCSGNCRSSLPVTEHPHAVHQTRNGPPRPRRSSRSRPGLNRPGESLLSPPSPRPPSALRDLSKTCRPQGRPHPKRAVLFQQVALAAARRATPPPPPRTAPSRERSGSSAGQAPKATAECAGTTLNFGTRERITLECRIAVHIAADGCVVIAEPLHGVAAEAASAELLLRRSQSPGDLGFALLERDDESFGGIVVVWWHCDRRGG